MRLESFGASSQNYSPVVVQQHSAYRDVLKQLYNLGLRPILYYPAKLLISIRDGLKTAHFPLGLPGLHLLSAPTQFGTHGGLISPGNIAA